MDIYTLGPSKTLGKTGLFLFYTLWLSFHYVWMYLSVYLSVCLLDNLAVCPFTPAFSHTLQPPFSHFALHFPLPSTLFHEAESAGSCLRPLVPKSASSGVFLRKLSKVSPSLSEETIAKALYPQDFPSRLDRVRPARLHISIHNFSAWIKKSN